MVTIIGIPLGIQAFKMAKLALWPFGASIHGLYGHRGTGGNGPDFATFQNAALPIHIVCHV